jgi:hypothetical protein
VPSDLSGNGRSWRLPRPLVGALLVLGTAVSATVVPGVFTTDDNNYLINVLTVRQGRFTVANTEGLSPSQELLFFDPGPWARAVEFTPVASTAPPLYGLMALPFSTLGWRGLVALNTLAYLATIAIVFVYTRRYAIEPATPWLAAAAFALGGYVIEYAQGVWPHALSVALSTGGLAAAGRAIESGDPRESNRGDRWHLPAAAGFLLGMATGVRYQNAVLLTVAGGGLALWSAHRVKALTSFILAAAAPLAASVAINQVRLRSFNPISKGPGYLRVPLVEDPSGSLFDPLVMFWARVVDFSVRPPLVGPSFSWVTYEPITGAHLMVGETLQKALLQSAPWVILAFILFAAVWTRRFRLPEPVRRQLRLLSLVTLALMTTFAFSGVRRHEGLAFNQRYLLELLPLAAIGFAWALDEFKISVRLMFVGGLWGVLLALILLRVPTGGGPGDSLWLAQQLALLKLPILLSAALGVLWVLGRSRARLRPALYTAAGVCLAWGLTVHLASDVAASHRLRTRKLVETEALAGVLTNGSALVAYAGSKDAAVPLLFDRDLVILDARADEGKDAPLLIRELLARNRRVFVLEHEFPGHVLFEMLAEWHVVRILTPGMRLVELSARPG